LLASVGWVAAMLGARTVHAAGSRADLELIQNVADSTALHVTSVLIVGDTEGILIDTQFLAADARRVADRRVGAPTRTLIAEDLVFNGVHAWLAASSGDTRRDWSAALDRLSDLDPASVIAGHKPGTATPDDPASLATMIAYLAEFDAALAVADSAGDLGRQGVRRRPLRELGQP